jgi:CRISPR/Cas system-associated exonuclease Cas4 (RecB family)
MGSPTEQAPVTSGPSPLRPQQVEPVEPEPVPAPPKPQIHASGLAQFARCPVQWRFYQTLGPRPPGIALVVGKGVHKGVETLMAHKLRTGELPELEAAHVVAAASVQEQFERGVAVETEEERSAPIGKLRGAAQDKTRRLVTCYHDQLAPAIRPSHVEFPYVLHLNGYPCDLSGRLDLVETGTTIRDVKTRGRAPAKTEADTSLQYTAYALGFQHTIGAGRLPEAIIQDCLIDAAKPRAEPLRSERTDRHIAGLMRRLEAVMQAIEKEIYTPCDPEKSWWCSPRFCGYFDVCPYAG